jgi:hypothetical protein
MGGSGRWGCKLLVEERPQRARGLHRLTLDSKNSNRSNM